jgi:Putative auto-transporter adhesin, head GIN domain
MKKAIIIIAIVAVVAVICTVLVLKGWPGTLIGSGNLETKAYTFANFTKVEISSPFEFEIKQSNSYSINITADDNVMDYVQVTQEGQTLKIRLRTVLSLGPVTLRAWVAMPELSGLTVSGASRGTVAHFSSTGGLNIKVSGASMVTGDVTAGDIGLDVSGASIVELAGFADNMTGIVSGASVFDLGDFAVTNANVNISGASTGTIDLDGRLDANVSGASTLLYIGDPTMGTINVSGASTLRKK